MTTSCKHCAHLTVNDRCIKLRAGTFTPRASRTQSSHRRDERSPLLRMRQHAGQIHDQIHRAPSARNSICATPLFREAQRATREDDHSESSRWWGFQRRSDHSVFTFKRAFTLRASTGSHVNTHDANFITHQRRDSQPLGAAASAAPPPLRRSRIGMHVIMVFSG